MRTGQGNQTPPHNLYGHHGPLCPDCSGLGHVLRLGSPGFPTRSTARCRCNGTGVDLELVRDNEIERLHREVARLQKQYMEMVTMRDKRQPRIKNSRQFWQELIAWATADATAVANTTTETVIFPNVAIPANYMADGRSIRMNISGKHSTLGSGTVTLTFRMRWNGVSGTVICATGAITQVISLTNAYFEAQIQVQTRTNGSTGKLMGNGTVRVYGATAPTIGSATGAPAVAPMTNGGQTVPAEATVDLTTDAPLAITVQHGAASASNTVTGLQYTLESLN